jgi:hypothetical protein
MTFAGQAGASEQAVRSVEQSTGLKLPEEYVALIRRHNGGEGFIGSEYLILWKVEELVSFNHDYEVREYIPDLLLFGSNGGGEAYGFKTNLVPWEIIRVPFVGMAPDLCIKMGTSFASFLDSLGQS